MRNFNSQIPLSLYIHIPWCVQKCPYCDFNSHAVKGPLQEMHYVERLLVDLEQDLPKVWGRSIHSIFIGGGTPSLFAPSSIDHLLSGIHARIRVAPTAEITLEANPGTVEQARFEGYRAAGINRLSIGIQSFDSQQLKTLGRIHGAAEAEIAIEAARLSGFDNFNIDIMFGLPNQSLDSAMDDLARGLSFNPPHLSWYQLTIEPNTLFHHQPPTLPPDDALWDMQQAGMATLHSAGLEQYEVSAYSQPDRQSQHNMNYWQFGDYLGIGAGAHSKITNALDNTVTRYSKNKHPKTYLDSTQALIHSQNTLSDQDLAFEFMLNALRLNQRLTFELFTERTGLAITTLQPLLEKAVSQGLICLDEHSLTTTERGKQYLNELVAYFL